MLVRALTSVDLPWSTCPAVPMTYMQRYLSIQLIYVRVYRDPTVALILSAHSWFPSRVSTSLL